VFAVAPWCVSAAVAQVSSGAWVQMVPGGAELRVIANGTCSGAHFDSGNGPVSAPMTERAVPNDVFPRLCTVPIPATANSVSIDSPELGVAKGEVVEIFRVPA